MSRASSVQLTAAACALCTVFAFPSAGRAQGAPGVEPPSAPAASPAAPSPAETSVNPAPVSPAPEKAATNPAPTPPPAPIEATAPVAVPSAPNNIAPTPIEAPSAPPPSKAASLVQARIYGFLNAQLERVWARGGSTPYDPRFRVTDGGSRLGFDGAIQIASRTKAVWQIEGSLNGFEQAGVSDQGTPAIIVSRNTFVGVEDERFGRLIAGNVDSAYRSLIGSGGAMGGNLGLTTLGLDLWNNTSAQLTGSAANIFSRGEARYQNSLHYFTPVWPLPPNGSNIRGAASYSFDETLANGRRRDRFSLAALYQVAGLSLGVGLDYQTNTGINVDN